MLTAHDELLEQLKLSRTTGIEISRDNIVSAGFLIVHDQAEVWRDVHGTLRIRRRRPDMDQWGE